MKILVTGGAGFIGSAVVKMIIERDGDEVVNVDCLTYAANLDSLKTVSDNPRYTFVRADITDAPAMRNIFAKHQPDAVVHLAAESHVDRSIDGPGAFIQTNIVGTFTLLAEARIYWQELSDARREKFRFHHVSTDEVYGSLGSEGAFTETTPYAPSSPYSASKASSDMLVRAWGETYGLPILITNCSNNYGPCQFPEKLIPVVVLNALAGKEIPVYGNGMNIRDWLYVDDHADALLTVLRKGRVGETYNIGGNNEMTNIDMVHAICDIMDRLRPQSAPHRDLIKFVTDRPGHDFRYAIDASKISSELGWAPKIQKFEGLEQTVEWYLQNDWWWKPILAGGHSTDRQGSVTA